MSTQINTVTAQWLEHYTPSILLVDDELPVLSALSRVFKRLGYEILTSETTQQALDVMTSRDIDVVVSDMRMPGMDGVELLQRVRRNWPMVTRVLMTGEADLTQAVRAINQGGIHHYVQKPWDDDELRTILEEAVNRSLLYRENQRLMRVTQTQNARLTTMTEKLESLVKQRTEALTDTNTKLERSNKSLSRSYRSTIKVLSSLVQMHPGIDQGMAQQAAEIAYAMATIGELPKTERLYVYFAAQLHELGKMALREELLITPYKDLSNADQQAFKQYPILGELALSGVEYLKEVGTFVACHQENWDGQGYPRRISGYDVPVGSRIVRVARDYVVRLRELESVAPKFRARHAMVDIRAGVGIAYDADVVNWLDKYLERMKRENAMEDEVPVIVRQLMPGMIISRDFYTSHGVMMLAKDHVLTERNVHHLVDLQRMEKTEINVWIYT